MNSTSAGLLILAVAVVGVLHTIVPDHWAPIAVLARQRGWTLLHAARAAAIAGIGHTASTLLIAAVVWFGGVALAVHYGHALSVASSLALVLFGGWIALASLRELREDHHGHAHFGHGHLHGHADGLIHRHWHGHHEADWHETSGSLALTPIHEHAHETSSRTALLLILGSSPMIEGIPAFFAASRFGWPLLVVMALVFGACTICTYVGVTVLSLRAAQRLDLGPLERYGEVLSGGFIAALGIVFLLFPQLL